jgi:DNA-binding transcriptional ArsR family regulator
MSAFSSTAVARIVQRCRALGEPTRVRILEVLARRPQPVSRIVQALGAGQSNVSKHLQVLFHAGLVTRKRSAGTVVYALADRHLIEWCAALGGRIGQAGR